LLVLKLPNFLKEFPSGEGRGRGKGFENRGPFIEPSFSLESSWSLNSYGNPNWSTTIRVDGADNTRALQFITLLVDWVILALFLKLGGADRKDGSWTSGSGSLEDVLSLASISFLLETGNASRGTFFFFDLRTLKQPIIDIPGKKSCVFPKFVMS
jgi:hypothetical protein